MSKSETCIMLTLFPHIPVFREQIHIFKTNVVAEGTELYRVAMKDKWTSAYKALIELLMVGGQSVSVIIINYGRGLLQGLYLLIDVVSLDSAWNAV